MRLVWICVLTSCSREQPTARRDPVEPAPSSVTSAASVKVSAAPSVVEEPPPEPDPKWLARIAHGGQLDWVHGGERDVAMTLTKLFIDAKATAPDPTAVSFAATVQPANLVSGGGISGCGMNWQDVHLLAKSPNVRAAAHAFVLRVAAGWKPSPWSNGMYAGERVNLPRTPGVPWDDGGLFGILFRGDEVLLLHGNEFAVGDADCPSLEEVWKLTLTRKPAQGPQ